MDDNHIMDSHEKLTSLLESKKAQNEAIKSFLQSVNYSKLNDFKPGLEWFNVSEPLTFGKHLKGKLVLLDFFTYCCINCMHILPDLHDLEHEFSVEKGLVVIGVHSAKFANEKDSDNVKSAVQRYNISHPVVNDKDMEVWTSCDVHCWPTLLLINPEGKPILMLMGEGHKKTLQDVISVALDFYKDKISGHSLPISPSMHLLEAKLLKFPGKIVCRRLNANTILFAISDSNNNRILILKNYQIDKIVGSGVSGFKDGSLDTCQFNQPQGLCFLDDDTLFVADTENHAIRKICISENLVTTVAGTGVQSNDKIGGKAGKDQGISSPWDVCLYVTKEQQKNVILIAMAGTHQIWALFLENETRWWKNLSYDAGIVVAIAGSGREENRNNQYPLNAAFAQPSGLALCSQRDEVYIADSESSAIRKLSLLDGKVSGVVGGDANPRNLFAFGDKSGSSTNAKLQHPLGVCASANGKFIYVTDTYNHKIKKIDIDQNQVSTLSSQSNMKFNEPAGLCQDPVSKNIFVADTNSHDIKILTVTEDEDVVVDVHTMAVTTSKDGKCNAFRPTVENTLTWPKPIVFDGSLVLKISLVPEGMHWNQEAPQSWYVCATHDGWTLNPKESDKIQNKFEIKLSAAKKADVTGKVTVHFSLMSCDMTDKNVCYSKKFCIVLPVQQQSKSQSQSQEIQIKVTKNKVLFG